MLNTTPSPHKEPQKNPSNIKLCVLVSRKHDLGEQETLGIAAGFRTKSKMSDSEVSRIVRMRKL